MKTPALITLLLLAITSAGFASTINFATGSGRGHMVVTSGGDRVATGSLVRLGTLAEPGNLATFQEFGRTTISDPSPQLPGTGGFLTIPVSNGDQAQNAAAAGKQIYLWIYATPDESNASAIFTSTDTSWTVPQTFNGAADQTSNLNLALAEGITAIDAPGGLPGAAWTRGPIDLLGQAPEGSIFIIPVPEPSAALLTGMVTLAALGRRRR